MGERAALGRGEDVWRLMVLCCFPARVRVLEDSWGPSCQCGVHQVRRVPWGPERDRGGGGDKKGKEEKPNGVHLCWSKFRNLGRQFRP